ncbi:MAG: translation initiation factor IF-3 [Myxococcota bacterium]|nr:translation initiation factor IF-3 [Myxococcota bacterium]MDW8363674.1 translation initiation factor IF-3 [Myxococcales bacterium]
MTINNRPFETRPDRIDTSTTAPGSPPGRDLGRAFGPRINERIRVPEVRVIGPAGEVLGVMPTDEARRIAREQGFDLVEVNPKAIPPVCKVMDYGKHKYEEKKRASEARRRQTQVDVKEIKLRPKTDAHDIEVKVRHIRRFLEDGDKVKLTVRFRGREISHPETAERQLSIVLEKINDVGVIEQAARMDGKQMTALVAPRVRPGSGPRRKDGVVPAARPDRHPHPQPAAATSASTPSGGQVRRDARGEPGPRESGDGR